jgi:hypothetical protein
MLVLWCRCSGGYSVNSAAGDVLKFNTVAVLKSGMWASGHLAELVAIWLKGFTGSCFLAVGRSFLHPQQTHQGYAAR